MGKNYLHDCLERFPEVSKRRFGCTVDLKALEEAVEDLRSNTVSVRDILTHFRAHFQNTEHWWFHQYWLFPSLDDLSDEDQTKIIDFHPLSEQNEGKPLEKKVIHELLEAFRQIELVSIILRFVCPVSFGILSPPVEYLLGLHSGKNAAETYGRYLRNIRTICEKYEFRTVAETDMALWVLKHTCYDEQFKDAAISQKFNNDEFMLRLRAKNLVEPLHALSPAQMANAFCDVKNDLAALVGCYALEKSVKEWARVEGVEKEARELAKEKLSPTLPTLNHYSAALCANKQGKLSSLESERKNLDSLTKIRNKVFHGQEAVLDEVRNLVKTVWKIEQRLKKHSGR